MTRGGSFLVGLACVVASAGSGTSPGFAQRVEAVEPNRGGTLDLSTRDPEKALEHLHVADGYVVELFASEQDFPIGNPVSLTFDGEGRLWVATMPSYPQRLPDEEPRDKLVILEDRDGDGRADHHTVFADGLHLPGGFELGDGGAYVAQQPDLMFFEDTDGDEIADRSEVVLHGFGTEDSHHAISAFTWGPGGALYFQEGVFHHSQVETPWGPVRLVDAGVFRYEPQRHWLEVFVSYPFANPWGHVFDRWGQNFIADASGGSNYFGTAITGYAPYPMKRRPLKVFTSVVRPTAGCEIVSSRHFPPEAQGNFLINNTIGFQGIKQHRVIDEGSGFTSEEVEPLLYSTDINFRPVDLQFGPDGALYIVDWWNPLIGHMQYSLRDPRRDTGHGRIWRIRHAERALLEPRPVAGASIAELLGNLDQYEDRLRYRTRRELRQRERSEVLAAIDSWLASPTASGDAPEANQVVLAPREHRHLEALWLHQMLGEVDTALLDEVLGSPEPRARAAATRVLRFWRDQIDGAPKRLEKLVRDPHPRVRLEAVLAASFLAGKGAAQIALAALDQPRDDYLDYVIGETVDTLEPHWAPALGSGSWWTDLAENHRQFLLARLETERLLDLPQEPSVLRALLLRPDVAPEVADQALALLEEAAGEQRAALLLDRLAEADAAGEEGSVARLGRALLELFGDSPEGVDSELAVRLSTFGQQARLLATAEWLLAANAARTGELPDLSGAAGVDSTLLALRALARFPPDLRQRAWGTVERMTRETPPALADVLAQPVDRIRLALGGRGMLQIAEVEVLDREGRPVLRGAPIEAEQSSTSRDGVAALAVDGERETASATFFEQSPWLEVRLSRPVSIGQVVLRLPDPSTGRLASDRLSIVALAGERKVFELRGFRRPESDPGGLRLVVDSANEVRRHAIAALSSMPDDGEETFAVLLDRLAEDGPGRAGVAAEALDGLTANDPSAVVSTLGHLGRQHELTLALDRHLRAVSVAELTAPNVRRWVDTADRLVSGAVRSEAIDQLATTISQRAIQQITIRPVPHQMVFDTLEFSVQAGRPLEIRLENPDVMPHNLVVTQPGGLEDVGEMAEQMARTDPAAAEAANYVPRWNDEVIRATPLVLPGQSAALAFLTPEEPGLYPFVCTFPGHWILMNGIMRVVPAGSDVDPPVMRKVDAETEQTEVREFVKAWSLERLEPVVLDSPQGPWSTGAQIEAGAELFVAVGCSKCHAKNGEGGDLGPALDDLGSRYDAVETLRHVLDPSATVAEEYETTVIEKRDGRLLVGIVVASDADSVSLRADPLEPERVTTVARSDIKTLSRTSLSPMPSGLLVTLEEEEILDLLRFLRNTR